MKIGTEIGIGIVIGVVMTIGLVVGGFFGFVFLTEQASKNHDQKVEQAEIDGREFGKTTDQNGCMEKGFTISDKQFLMTTYKFIGECLESSRSTPDFCKGVPLSDNFSQSKWSDEQCQKVGHTMASCKIAFGKKLDFCKRANEYGQAKSDGREFGKTTDQNGCMEKGFTLPSPIPNNGSDLSNYSFIGECLKSSRPTPDFCEGVPLLYDRKWFDEQCQKVGHNPLGSCSVAFSTKRTFCLRSNEYKSK